MGSCLDFEARAVVLRAADGARFGELARAFDGSLGREFWRGPLARLGDIPKQPEGTVWALLPLVDALNERDFGELTDVLTERDIPGLSLYEVRVPAAAWRHLARAPSLRLLDLQRGPVADKDLETFPELPSLEHLFL